MSDLHQLEAPLTRRPSNKRAGHDAPFGILAVPPHQQRQLPERILVAAHQACDMGELEVADRLLSVLDAVLAPAVASAAQRRIVEGMVAAYERLWHLRRRIGP